MAGERRYNDFEDTAREWLTEVVDVSPVTVSSGMGGVRENRGQMSVTGLPASIQPRSAFATHTVMGWLPEQTHVMYCRALDENGAALDIKLGYELNETRGGKWYKVVGAPELFNHPETGRGHHLEIAVKLLAKFT